MVLGNDGQNHPKLIWGPYPGPQVITAYKIDKRKGGITYSEYLISTNLDKEDPNEQLCPVYPPCTSGDLAWYKVRATNASFESLASNEINAIIQGTGGIEKSQVEFQKDYLELNQNYPNPFNPVTSVSFALPNPEYVTLIIYDILGREIKSLISNNLEKGTHIVQFDAANLASGLYFYQLKAGSYIKTKKMQLLK